MDCSNQAQPRFPITESWTSARRRSHSRESLLILLVLPLNVLSLLSALWGKSWSTDEGISVWSSTRENNEWTNSNSNGFASIPKGDLSDSARHASWLMGQRLSLWSLALGPSLKAMHKHRREHTSPLLVHILPSFIPHRSVFAPNVNLSCKSHCSWSCFVAVSLWVWMHV